MSTLRDLTSALFVFFLQYCLINEGAVFVKAEIRSDSKGKIKHVNDFKIENSYVSHFIKNENTGKLPDEHINHYYLPEQTTFDSPHLLSSHVFFTSPPKFTIIPSRVQTENSYHQITDTSNYKHPVKVETMESVPTVQNQFDCLSQTPTLDLISESLFPSEYILKDRMSGRLETASKTDADEETSQLVLSRPSVIVQGTKVNIRRNPSTPAILSI